MDHQLGYIPKANTFEKNTFQESNKNDRYIIHGSSFPGASGCCMKYTVLSLLLLLASKPFFSWRIDVAIACPNFFFTSRKGIRTCFPLALAVDERVIERFKLLFIQSSPDWRKSSNSMGVMCLPYCFKMQNNKMFYLRIAWF